MNSAESQEEARAAGEASNNVIGRPQRDIRVIGVRLLRQQSLGLFIGFLEPLQRFDMLLLENHIGVRFHSRRQGQSEERFRVAFIFFEAPARERSSEPDGFLKTLHARGVGFPLNAVQESFFIQEKIAGENILAIKLLKEVAGGHSNFAEWLVRMLRFPAGKLFASFCEVLNVQGAKPRSEFRHVGERWGGTVGLRSSVADGR